MFSRRFDVVGSQADLCEIDFFFREHLVGGELPPVFTVFLSSTSGSFLQSIWKKDDAVKTFGLLSDSGPKVEACFQSWSGVPSPVPPFFVPAFSDGLQVLPGTVIVHPRLNRTVLLSGEIHVGKTATVGWLLENGPWQLLTDQLVVLDDMNGKVHPYGTPAGYRRRNLELKRKAIEMAEHRITISPETGPVALAHVGDVLGKNVLHRKAEVPTHWVHLTRIQGAKSVEVVTGLDNPAPSAWMNTAVAEALVQAEQITITVPEGVAPEAIAIALEKAVLAS